MSAIKDRPLPRVIHIERYVWVSTGASDSRIADVIGIIPLTLVPLRVDGANPSVHARCLSGSCSTRVGSSSRVASARTRHSVACSTIVLHRWGATDAVHRIDITVEGSCAVGRIEHLAGRSRVQVAVGGARCAVAYRCTVPDCVHARLRYVIREADGGSTVVQRVLVRTRWIVRWSASGD